VNRRGFFDASAATLSDTLDLVIAGPGGTVEGIVRDARDRPGAGSQVVLVPTGERRENPSAFQTAFADEAGRFSIRGVPPGDYGVLAWEDVPEGAWLNAEFLSDFETRMERLHIETTDREILDILVVAD
jgi:hypothetical protein